MATEIDADGSLLYSRKLNMNYHLSQVGDLPDKTKCDVILRLLTCEMKTGKTSGKTYWNGKVADVQNPTITLYASFFGNSPAALIGQDLIVTGMEKGSYNGKAQLSASKFSKYNEYVPDLEAATPRQEPPAAGYYPKETSARSVPQNRLAVPPELKVNLPLGQTVGMAIKLAADIMLAQDPAIFRQPNWDNTMRSIAAQIITVSRSLETDTPLTNEPF